MYKKHETASKVYKNGTIITMTGEDKIEEAVATQGDKILAVGSMDELNQYIGKETKIEDLNGNTMLPGFYDAHSHFSMVGTGNLLYTDLSSPPMGKFKSIEDYISVLKEKAKNTPKGKAIIGNSYDSDAILEKRHPNRWDLDRVSTEHPVILIHYSYHTMVCNSEALRVIGVDENTPNPDDGIIIKNEKGIPTGVLEEGAAMKYVLGNTEFKLFGTHEERVEAIKRGSEIYASQGITTANEGGGADFNIFREAYLKDYLKIRTILWFDPSVSSEDRANMDLATNMITKAGTKVFQDGSIQLATAYLTEPYYKIPAGQEDDYRGYPTQSREDLTETVKKAHNDGLQVYAHCNGDAAIDDVLYAFETAQKENPTKDPRHVAIHAQTARYDQLEKMKELGVIPSFFIASLFKNGDVFSNTYLGPDRVRHINPIKSAYDMNINATMHTDSPVMPPNPLLAMWVAVNRETSGGNIIGEAERISIYDALMANTLYAAYQNKEETAKGSIEAGKLADFVILDKNPLTVSSETIKDIQVLKTIVGDEIVYSNK